MEVGEGKRVDPIIFEEEKATRKRRGKRGSKKKTTREKSRSIPSRKRKEPKGMILVCIGKKI